MGFSRHFVRTYTYLGTMMTCDNADDANMRRQRGICYARANGITKNFSMCSPVVKATLFRTFCSNMTCIVSNYGAISALAPLDN